MHRVCCACCTLVQGTVYRLHCTTACSASTGNCLTFSSPFQFLICVNQLCTTVHRINSGCGCCCSCHCCCRCCCKLLPPAALSHAAYLRAAPAATAIFVNKIFRSSLSRKREKKNINERFSEFNVCVLFSSVANAV